MVMKYKKILTKCPYCGNNVQVDLDRSLKILDKQNKYFFNSYICPICKKEIITSDKKGEY
jgi:DNA-directed RNA polymerase subunit RPC12/RpoP